MSVAFGGISPGNPLRKENISKSCSNVNIVEIGTFRGLICKDVGMPTLLHMPYYYVKLAYTLHDLEA